jgi:hypothetical protein
VLLVTVPLVLMLPEAPTGTPRASVRTVRRTEPVVEARERPARANA